MTTYEIATIVGSLRKGSINGQLARALTKLAPPAFHVRMAWVKKQCGG